MKDVRAVMDDAMDNAMGEAALTIGEVARRASVATSAIRYYESIGLLPSPVRHRNGHRYYEASAIQRLRVIEHAQKAGFTLGEIRELFFGFAAGTHPDTRWDALAERKLTELAAQLARIRAMQALLREGLHCHCLTMEQCTIWLSGLEPTA
ncbi:MAG TPA: MerR family transcriptional regulator [Ktedonobacterales bacterium]